MKRAHKSTGRQGVGALAREVGRFVVLSARFPSRWRLFLLGFVTAWSAFFSLLAQRKGVEMADLLRSEGKFYVVVGVMLLLLIGFLAYLYRIDRRITALKKRIEEAAKKKGQPSE